MQLRKLNNKTKSINGTLIVAIISSCISFTLGVHTFLSRSDQFTNTLLKQQLVVYDRVINSLDELHPDMDAFKEGCDYLSEYWDQGLSEEKILSLAKEPLFKGVLNGCRFALIDTYAESMSSLFSFMVINHLILVGGKDKVRMCFEDYASLPYNSLFVDEEKYKLFFNSPVYAHRTIQEFIDEYIYGDGNRGRRIELQLAISYFMAIGAGVDKGMASLQDIFDVDKDESDRFDMEIQRKFEADCSGSSFF